MTGTMKKGSYYYVSDPQYYKWLKPTHPSYAEEWYNYTAKS